MKDLEYSQQTHPDEQLSDDHIGHGAGQVQSGAPVPIPVGLINLFLGTVCQQQHHQPQVILHHRPKQLLPQRHVGLGQPHQEKLLFVLGPDPALLLLPGEKETTRTSRSGRAKHGTNMPMSKFTFELKNFQRTAPDSEADIWNVAKAACKHTREKLL